MESLVILLSIVTETLETSEVVVGELLAFGI